MKADTLFHTKSNLPCLVCWHVVSVVFALRYLWEHGVWHESHGHATFAASENLGSWLAALWGNDFAGSVFARRHLTKLISDRLLRQRNGLMIYNKIERVLVITKRIFNCFTTNFSLEITSKVHKVNQKYTFTHELTTKRNFQTPSLFFSSTGTEWNAQDCGISKAVKDTSMLPSKIDQMKVSHETGSETNFGFVRALMPSYLGMLPPKDAAYICTCSVGFSLPVEKEHNLFTSAEVFNKITDFDVWKLLFWMYSILFSAVLSLDDCEFKLTYILSVDYW